MDHVSECVTQKYQEYLFYYFFYSTLILCYLNFNKNYKKIKIKLIKFKFTFHRNIAVTPTIAAIETWIEADDWIFS